MTDNKKFIPEIQEVVYLDSSSSQSEQQIQKKEQQNFVFDASKIAKQLTDNQYAIKLEKDQLLMDSLGKFAQEKKIGFAKFEMIGALKDTILGCVKGTTGVYQWKHFPQQAELVSCSGNIAWDHDNPDTPLVHCHVSISDENFNVFGGHLKEAKSAIVIEGTLTILSDEKTTRKLDENVNLKLWEF